MFIKCKILNYWLLLLIFINVCSRYGVSVFRKNGMCHNSKILINTTINKDVRRHSTNFQDQKYNTLQSIIKDFISRKVSQYNDQPADEITENIFSMPNRDSSLKSPEYDIHTTSMNDDTSAPEVVSFPTQSSFSSSQLYTGHESPGQLEAGTKVDLNETVKTFHKQVESKTVSLEQAKSENKTSLEMPEVLASENDTTTSTVLTSDVVQEDMPSFHEWTEKRLAKEEKRGRNDDNVTNVPANGKSHKVRNKNYASLDCGAKVLTTNKEAKSPMNLLSSSRDEYMLSVCSSKIFFVVELCEVVQLKEIELANFELFSSSPKDFTVEISDRFPSRDWILVGQFTAKDEKSIQSFNLEYSEPLFTKYIKLEIKSHYGYEHYCPISLFRVYGTSEFEVLETVDGSEEREIENVDIDNDLNEPIMLDIGDRKKKSDVSYRLFGRAKDLVMKIMKEVGALVSSPSQYGNSVNVNNTADSTVTENRVKFSMHRPCVTPRYMILCRKCKEEFFHRLYRLMSCYLSSLQRMLEVDIVWKPLIKYNVCLAFGITSFYLRDHVSSLMTSRQIQVNELYVVHLLPREMLASLCNLIAISENRLKQNVTLDESLLLNQTLKKCDNVSAAQSVYNTLFPVPNVLSESESSVSFKIEESPVLSTQLPDGQTVVSLLRPTKVLTDHLLAADHSSVLPTIPTFVPRFSDIVDQEQIQIPVTEDIEPPKLIEHPIDVPEESMESLISELETTSDQNAFNSIPTATQKPAVQKESVFVRLANRIKALERNMSLSGQYLEELSRRYKKQVEDMQRIVSETTEREAKRVQEINILAQQITILVRHINELTLAVDAQVTERESWSYKAVLVGEHSLIIFIEIVIFIGIVCLCRGIPDIELSKRKFSLEWRRNQLELKNNENPTAVVKRRQSFDDLTIRKSLHNQKRRPSEEAIKIDGATHQNLLIYETNRTSKSESRRKKRKRKELLLKSNANAMNLETGAQDNLTKKLTLTKNNAPLSRSASASEIDEHSWGKIDYGHQISKQEENVCQNGNEFPPFFNTALSVRTKRLSNHFNGKQIQSPVLDVSTDQESSALSTPVKEKKMNGIKKMVKRFF